MATNNKDQYNFRVGSEEKKEEIRKRTNALREEQNISAREIYEAGLRVYERGSNIQQLLDRRSKAISERDIFLNLFIDRNLKIMALNRRLRNKSDRYNDYHDEKDVLIIYDEFGDQITNINLTKDQQKLKNEFERKY